MKNQTLNYNVSFVFQALIYFLVLRINYSAPVNSSVTYANFLKEIQHDNCMFPQRVVLPFNSSTTFEYLGVHIKICTPSEEKKLERSREAIALCSDIFNILKNITCHPDTKAQIPQIKVEFSLNVCADISSLNSVPETEIMLKHLTDKYVCEMMCDDEFNPACQVLLWSYQVQQQLQSVVVEQKKIEGKEAVVDSNVESANLGNVQNEDVTVVASKDNLNSGNADNSPLNVPSNKTTPIDENSNNAKVETINHSENDKTEKTTIPEKSSSTIVKEAENQDKNNLLVKEKEVNHQISTMSDKKLDGENQNLVNVDEPPLKSNIVQANNLKKASILNKTKQSDANDNKFVPEKAGLVDEAVSKSQDLVPVGESSDTATNSNKDEPKTKTPTVANIETSSIGKTVPEIKDSKVISEKTKDTKISTLKTEVEKIGGAAEVANQNALSESFTGETNNIEDMSPITTAADLEKMEDGNEIPEPSDKNQEPYNDMESEGDYSKLDYDDADDGFYDSSKNKKTDLVEESKMPAVEPQNELPKYDVYQPRNSIGRGVEDIQVIPAFPEQEDSHFFFYFLSIVLILMGGYLLFHNKQKIIALIVEGRHERRRRSHGVGYKKLETK